jgi:hypothetical protein
VSIFSSGAEAMRGVGGRVAKNVARGATALEGSAGRASMKMGMASTASSGARSSLYKRGAQAASYVARNPRKSMGIGAGAAGAMGLNHMRKKGSQNYPMY